MKRDMENLDLRDAFPGMPEACRDALLQTVRSVKEEEPVKRTAIRTILIAAAIIIATTAVAFAAGNLIFGWVDYYGEEYNVRVPESAQYVMAKSEEKTFTLGPVVFTVKEQYCDPYTALASTEVHLQDGEKGVLCCLEVDDRVGEYAEFLNVSPETTYLDAASQLGCPLYRIWATLEMPEDVSIGQSMYDASYYEGSGLTFFSMALLNGEAAGDSLDCPLELTIMKIDPHKPETIQERYTETEILTMPLQIPSESVVYKLNEDYSAFGLTLTGARAELTPAGLYLISDFLAPEGMSLDDYNELGLLYPWLYSADGERYGGGLNLTFYEVTDNWPQLTIMSMFSMDSIPDTMLFVLEDGSDDYASMPRITLTK